MSSQHYEVVGSHSMGEPTTQAKKLILLKIAFNSSASESVLISEVFPQIKSYIE